MPKSKHRRKKSKSGAKKSAGIRPLDLIDRRTMEAILAILGDAGDPDDALAQAQDLVYEACQARMARERVALAKQALEISPLCADAYNILARHARAGSDEELELWRKAVEAGAAALGPETFEAEAGDFWLIFETRPYMRARNGLANALRARGAKEEALAHYADMLRLNPNDNQGIRDILAACLIELGRDTELAELLHRYEEDGSAAWTYSAALLAFRTFGAGTTSNEALAIAIANNPHVPAFLLGQRKLPKRMPPYYSPGEDSEAFFYVDAFQTGWMHTPGALDWLRRHIEQQEESRRLTA